MIEPQGAISGVVETPQGVISGVVETPQGAISGVVETHQGCHRKGDASRKRYAGVTGFWKLQGKFLNHLFVPKDQAESLGPGSHRTRIGTFARKFACKAFDVACNLGEHSH